MVFGRSRSPAPLEGALPAGLGHREVLEDLLYAALSRPPCRVAFSGGRDSSAILAAATRVARERGADDPVPLTLRFPDHPRTHESDWQERVVRHLGLARWEVVDLDVDLDGIGPVAGQILRRYGSYWPPNGHTIAWLLGMASGGSLLTGNGGDEIFSRRRAGQSDWRALLRVRPRSRALKLGVFGLLPHTIKARLWARRTVSLPWLRPAARAEVRRAYVARLSARRVDWGSALGDLVRSRYLELTLGTFEAWAREEDVLLVQPFFNARYLAALADLAPDGFADRGVAMRALFGDLLPRRSVERTSKASFTEVFFGPCCRAFVETWDGTGLDPKLVDSDALRREWSKPRPDFRSLMPLQAAWLATAAREETSTA